MSERDVVNHAPTCPVCSSREDVKRQHPHWLCGGCWTVFTGSQDEWERTRDMRDAWQKRYKPKGEAG